MSGVYENVHDQFTEHTAPVGNINVMHFGLSVLPLVRFVKDATLTPVGTQGPMEVFY